MEIRQRISNRNMFPKPESCISHTPEKTLTQQHFKEECDVNQIIHKYRKSGILPALTTQSQTPNYGDFSNVDDFHSTQNKLIQLNNDFMALSSDLRTKFENDPANLISYLSDPNNTEEAIQLGLLPKPKYEPKPKTVTKPKTQTATTTTPTGNTEKTAEATEN